MSGKLIIKFDGYDAEKHLLNMRQLGESLVGLDKVLNIGIFHLFERRPPKRGERLPLQIVANEPRKGSFEIQVLTAFVAGSLPFIPEILHTRPYEFLWHWISANLKYHGGDNKNMENVNSMLKMFFEDSEKQREHILNVIESQNRHLRDVIKPVGHSAKTASFSNNDNIISVDFPMAEAIRSKKELIIGDMETRILQVDGLIHHDKVLKVVNPEDPKKFVNAKVNDPQFEQPDNVYTQAIGKALSNLEVDCKIARTPDGRIYTIYIMNVINS